MKWESKHKLTEYWWLVALPLTKVGKATDTVRQWQQVKCAQRQHSVADDYGDNANGYGGDGGGEDVAAKLYNKYNRIGGNVNLCL